MIMSDYLKPDILKVVVKFCLLTFHLILISLLNKYTNDYNSGCKGGQHFNGINVNLITQVQVCLL